MFHVCSYTFNGFFFLDIIRNSLLLRLFLKITFFCFSIICRLFLLFLKKVVSPDWIKNMIFFSKMCFFFIITLILELFRKRYIWYYFFFIIYILNILRYIYSIFIGWNIKKKIKKTYCESKGTDFSQQTWNFESHISLISEGVNLCKIKTSWFYINYRLKYQISKGCM